MPSSASTPVRSRPPLAWLAPLALAPWVASAQTSLPDVTVTAGDLSEPYEILGEIRVDTTEQDGGGVELSALAVSRGGVFVAFRPELKGKPSEMLNALRDAAIARYGARVDAVVNATVFHEDAEGFARGVAVHFTKRAPEPLRQRSITERLEELDALAARGLVSPDEYKARRKAILGDL